AGRRAECVPAVEEFVAVEEVTAFEGDLGLGEVRQAGRVRVRGGRVVGEPDERAPETEAARPRVGEIELDGRVDLGVALGEDGNSGEQDRKSNPEHPGKPGMVHRSLLLLACLRWTRQISSGVASS